MSYGKWGGLQCTDATIRQSFDMLLQAVHDYQEYRYDRRRLTCEEDGGRRARILQHAWSMFRDALPELFDVVESRGGSVLREDHSHPSE